MKTDIHILSYLVNFFLEWEFFQTKVVEKSKHILCSVIFFPPKNRAVYEIIWKNFVDPDRPQMTIWRNAHCMLDNYGYNIHSEYVILIIFHYNNGLPERPSMLRYTYLTSIVLFSKSSRLALVPNQPPILWVTEVKRPEYEAEVKNECTFTSTPPTCVCAAHREHVTFRAPRVKQSRKNELERICMEAVVAELKVISRCMDGLRGTTHTAVSLSVSGTVPVKVPTVKSLSSISGTKTGNTSLWCRGVKQGCTSLQGPSRPGDWILYEGE